MSQKILAENKKGRMNLLVATLVCVPGPMLLAFGMRGGANSTQIADLIKRSGDFLTVALAWLVYELTIRNSMKIRTKIRLEKFIKYFTGISMCLSGLIMIYVAVADTKGVHGNMLPSLFLATTGALINIWLYFSYRSMNNPVLLIQAKLHRTKALLDGGLAAIMLIWILCTHDTVRHYADSVGTVIISLYLIFSGLKILDFPKLKGKKQTIG